MKFPPPVNAYVEDIPRVKLEVDPRATVRNHSRRVEQFAAGVRFSFIVLEKNSGGAMELTHDHPLRPVDHECPVDRHEGDFAEVTLMTINGTFMINGTE